MRRVDGLQDNLFPSAEGLLDSRCLLFLDRVLVGESILCEPTRIKMSTPPVERDVIFENQDLSLVQTSPYRYIL
jgi:hypothetical protein